MASSYIAMRVRYCVTISREVVRPSFIAACISGIVASTTEKGARDDSGAGGAAGVQAAVRQTRDRRSDRLEDIGTPFGKAPIMAPSVLFRASFLVVTSFRALPGLLVILISLFASAALAQDTTGVGAIAGRVLDAAGAPVGGRPDLRARYLAVRDQRGRWHVPHHRPPRGRLPARGAAAAGPAVHQRAGGGARRPGRHRRGRPAEAGAGAAVGHRHRAGLHRAGRGEELRLPGRAARDVEERRRPAGRLALRADAARRGDRLQRLPQRHHRPRRQPAREPVHRRQHRDPEHQHVRELRLGGRHGQHPRRRTAAGRHVPHRRLSRALHQPHVQRAAGGAARGQPRASSAAGRRSASPARARFSKGRSTAARARGSCRRAAASWTSSPTTSASAACRCSTRSTPRRSTTSRRATACGW